MKITFRTDASLIIGTGHVMRCLTLAMALKRKGAEVLFVCREHPGHLCEEIAARGFMVARMPVMSDRQADETTGKVERPDYAHWIGALWKQDAEETRQAINKTFSTIDWLIVDHYALDARWETVLRPHTKRLMVIDDLADRSHDCDLLLDQNLIAGMESRYNGLVPPGCTCLLGPRHALLRPQFAEAREKLRARDGSVQRILVFFGGGDSRAEILKAWEALRRLNKPDIAIDVVASCADRAVIDAVRSELPGAVVHGHVEDVASLMAAADLTLGAAGSTTWERCCLGLPAVTVSLAANQHLIGVSVGEVGAARHLGRSGEVTVDAMERAIRELIEAPAALVRMSARALELVDGLGTTRVSTAMQEA